MTLPKEILFEKYADTGFFWQGQIDTHRLPRLNDSLQADSELALSCRLEKHQGLVWLSFELSGDLFLTCHRCLAPMPYQVDGKYQMAILTDERQIAALENQDYILLSELGDERYLPLLDLLEDELLLTLPLSSTHSDCTMRISQVGELPTNEKENPFAVLEALKSRH